MIHHRDAPSYNQQCLIAIVRALPVDDEYGNLIEAEIKGNPNWTLQEFTHNYDDVPFFCSHHEFTQQASHFTLEAVRDLREDSDIVKAWNGFLKTYNKTSKPHAMFLRLTGKAQERRINVVVHSLNMFRTSWDPAVMETIRPPGKMPIFIERRTTFCRLMSAVGLWAVGRDVRIVPIDWDSYNGDLRKKHRCDILQAAIGVAHSWGYQRKSAKMFRGLTDSKFVEVVMEMQMKRRIESGSWA